MSSGRNEKEGKMSTSVTSDKFYRIFCLRKNQLFEFFLFIMEFYHLKYDKASIRSTHLE